MTKCDSCSQPAASRVRTVTRAGRVVLADQALCADHVQVEMTLAASPGFEMIDVDIMPLSRRFRHVLRQYLRSGILPFTRIHPDHPDYPRGYHSPNPSP